MELGVKDSISMDMDTNTVTVILKILIKKTGGDCLKVNEFEKSFSVSWSNMTLVNTVLLRDFEL